MSNSVKSNPVKLSAGRIIQAPMEGVVDHSMRKILTDFGGVDQCVTEFIRVTDRLLPRKDFKRKARELEGNGHTPSGIPVAVQLLGSEPEALAMNAVRVVNMGAPSIDLNFGCPSKTVNKHRGGAVLLDEPELIHDIIKAVRKSVPDNIPVTAKMRLGNRDKSRALDNAQAIEAAGASSLAVHARTKVEGYKPPAHWEWIAKIKDEVSLPVVANGEIWTCEDYIKCRQISTCDDVMIGRGLIARPEFALMIKSMLVGDTPQAQSWQQVIQMLLDYFTYIEAILPPKYTHGRMKQWLRMMCPQREEAEALFIRIKSIKDLAEIRAHLEAEL